MFDLIDSSNLVSISVLSRMVDMERKRPLSRSHRRVRHLGNTLETLLTEVDNLVNAKAKAGVGK